VIDGEPGGNGTLLGVAAPAAWASPGCDDAVLPVRRFAFNGRFGITGNTPWHRIRPRPLWGQGWRKGGCRIRKILHVHTLSGPSPHENLCVSKNFSGNFDFSPEKSGPFELLAGKISIQIFLRFSTFGPKIFRPGKFRGQKKYGFPDLMAQAL
jgi:hypothetical protein